MTGNTASSLSSRTIHQNARVHLQPPQQNFGCINYNLINLCPSLNKMWWMVSVYLIS